MSYDIYVDDYQKPHKVNGFLMGCWSHLFCHPQSTERLIAFANTMGLKPEWIQHTGTYKEHFDVTETMRQKAISMGAIPVDVKTGAKLRRPNKRRKTLDRTGADS